MKYEKEVPPNMPLTAKQVENIKPEAKTKKYFDGGGMYLEVSPKGGKWWRLKYRFEGREKRISLGTLTDVSLKDAREKRDDARRLLAKNIDPAEVRKAEKASHASENSFEAIAREWHNKHKHKWAEKHCAKILRRFELYIFPWIGRKPITSVTPPDLLNVLRRIEEAGYLETAHRAQSYCSQVFRYGISTHRAERDPCQDIKGAIPPATKKHYPTITDPKEVAELMRAIDGYEGHFTTQCALKIAPLVFVRPGELGKAEWTEIDLEKAEWRIPAEKMKKREIHIVPLSKQAVSILEELKPVTDTGGKSRYVFPSLQSLGRHMSENTLNTALRRMGYPKDKMVAHGFRGMATTLLNEQGYNRDAIERQLAHAERNNVRAAYNHAEYLPERKKMMQEWADYLDELKAGSNVINAKFGG